MRCGRPIGTSSGSGVGRGGGTGVGVDNGYKATDSSVGSERGRGVSVAGGGATL